MKQLLTILSIVSLLTACNSAPTTQEKEEEHGHEHSEGPTNEAELTLAQMKAAGIETDTVQLKNLSTSVKASGMLKVPNNNKALVTSITNGVIRTLLVQPGDFVKKGQVIATIINPDIARIQQDLQTTNAQISLSELEQRRQKELVEGNAAPLKNLQRTETELVTLKATRNALQQQLQTMGISASAVNSGTVVTLLSVRAPISGTISSISAQIGSNVDPSTPIAQIVNNSQLHLDLFVYEKDLSKLKPKQTIHFTITNSAGKEYDAEIYSIGTAFESDTKTIPVHAVVKGDKSGLIEGMNITAVISIGNATVPAIPTEAIVSSGGQDYIFIQLANPPAAKEEKHEHDHSKEDKHDHAHDHAHDHKDGEKHDHAEKEAPASEEPSFHFEKLAIVKGATDIGFTEIIPINPIPAGAKIVTKGAFFILAKMSNTGGHSH